MRNKRDVKFMNIALKQAETAFRNGDYPIGAVLVIDGKVVDKNRNKLYSEKNWASHAESLLIRDNSRLIKDKIDKENSIVELYTTVEPCLMCLGIAVLHRVKRIVYACPDPYGGACHINSKNLSKWYKNRWPAIHKDVCKNKACGLMIEFIKKQNGGDWHNFLKAYNNILK